MLLITTTQANIQQAPSPLPKKRAFRVRSQSQILSDFGKGTGPQQKLMSFSNEDMAAAETLKSLFLTPAAGSPSKDDDGKVLAQEGHFATPPVEPSHSSISLQSRPVFRLSREEAFPRGQPEASGMDQEDTDNSQEEPRSAARKRSLSVAVSDDEGDNSSRSPSSRYKRSRMGVMGEADAIPVPPSGRPLTMPPALFRASRPRKAVIPTPPRIDMALPAPPMLPNVPSGFVFARNTVLVLPSLSTTTPPLKKPPVEDPQRKSRKKKQVKINPISTRLM